MLTEIVAFHQIEVYEEDGRNEDNERDDDGQDNVLDTVSIKTNRPSKTVANDE